MINPSPLEVYYPELIHIAGARAERAEDPAPLLAVRRRLEVAKNQQGAGEELMRSIVDRLLELDPEIAQRIVKGLQFRYKLRLGIGSCRVEGGR